MEMWDWLVPWWNWWADLTDLFDWDAIGAIATAAAVIVALDQSTKVQRTSNRRNAAVIDDLLGMIEPIAESFPHDADGYLDQISLQVLEQSDLFKRAETGLGKYDPVTIREAGVSLSLEYIRDTLKGVQLGAYASLRADTGDGPPSFAWLADLEHIYAELIEVRLNLKHGRIGAALLRRIDRTRYAVPQRPFSPGHISDI